MNSVLKVDKIWVDATHFSIKYVLSVRDDFSYISEDLRSRMPLDTNWDSFIVETNNKLCDRSTWSYDIEVGNPRVANLHLNMVIEKLIADFGDDIVSISDPIPTEDRCVTRYFVKQDNMKKWDDWVHGIDSSIPQEYNNVITVVVNNTILMWAPKYAY